MSNIIQTFPKGSGGGHIVLDTNGTVVNQEKKLQFTGLDVSDDSTNEKTEVKAVGLNADSLDDIIQSASIPGNQVASNGLVYSTEEQVVGKWIDGKPLYQKTVIINSPNTVWATGNAHNISNIDTIVKADIGFRNTANGDYQPYYRDSGDHVTIICEKDYVRLATTQNVASVWVNVQYTKTTDT